MTAVKNKLILRFGSWWTGASCQNSWKPACPGWEGSSVGPWDTQLIERWEDAADRLLSKANDLQQLGLVPGRGCSKLDIGDPKQSQETHKIMSEICSKCSLLAQFTHKCVYWGFYSCLECCLAVYLYAVLLFTVHAHSHTHTHCSFLGHVDGWEAATMASLLSPLTTLCLNKHVHYHSLKP